MRPPATPENLKMNEKGCGPMYVVGVVMLQPLPLLALQKMPDVDTSISVPPVPIGVVLEFAVNVIDVGEITPVTVHAPLKAGRELFAMTMESPSDIVVVGFANVTVAVNEKATEMDAIGSDGATA